MECVNNFNMQTTLGLSAFVTVVMVTSGLLPPWPPERLLPRILAGLLMGSHGGRIHGGRGGGQCLAIARNPAKENLRIAKNPPLHPPPPPPGILAGGRRIDPSRSVE